MASHLDAPGRGNYLKYALLFLAVTALTAFLAVRFLFRGQELPVPNLIGMHLDSARQILQTKGLELKISDQQYDNFIAEGNIIAQRPKPGNRVKKGRMIRVTASLGSKVIKVPDLTGQDVRLANLLLLQNGLAAGTNSLVDDPDQPRNKVIGQDPEPESQIARGEAVSFLIVSGAPQEHYLMPDLTYHPFTDHLADFTKDLFQLDKLRDETQDDLPAFTIVKQLPAPGSRIGRGDKVELTLSHLSNQDARYRLLKLQVPSGPEDKRVRIELKDQSGIKAVMDEDRPAGSFLKLPILVDGRGTAKIYVNGRLTMEREVNR